MAGGKIVAVAEDGFERLRHGAVRRLPVHKILVDMKRFKPTMQPLGRARVGVTVGNEGAIFERDGLGHSWF
jgi:hypothetical protein